MGGSDKLPPMNTLNTIIPFRETSEAMENFVQPMMDNNYYHDFNHVQQLFKFYRETFLEDFCSHDESGHVAISYAIMFHDCVYNTKRTDNEQKSATMLLDYMRLSHNAVYWNNIESVMEAYELILLTKTHKMSDYKGEYEYLAKMMIDCDLSPLACSSEQFKINRKNIRKEYSHVPEISFIAGTKAFYEGMINRDRIFQTKVAYSKCEEQARKNIEQGLRDIGF